MVLGDIGVQMESPGIALPESRQAKQSERGGDHRQETEDAREKTSQSEEDIDTPVDPFFHAAIHVRDLLVRPVPDGRQLIRALPTV